MVAALGAALLLQVVTLGGRIQSGVAVAPDTVTVGSPFTITVRVRAPREAEIEFPQTPDSGGAVEALDPVVVVPSPDTLAVEATATYRVAAWDVGAFTVTFPEIIVRERIGERRVRVANADVVVASVLPPDSALRVPKPARDVFRFGPPWWFWALIALAAAGILALLWWLWKRRRTPVTVTDPYDAAQRAFERIDTLGLISAGERSRYVALMVEVLREYLAALVPAAATSLTTIELLGTLRGNALPTARLAALLAEVDLVKFAGRPVTASRAAELGREARLLVDAIRAATTGLERAA